MIYVTFCAYEKPDSIGGPLTWLAQMLPGLREHGIESRCLFLTHWGDTGPYLEKLRAEGFDCDQAACHEHTYDRIRWILSRLKENPPDVFVPNLVVAGYFAARWVRAAGIPTVGILHSDDALYRGIQHEFVLGRKDYQVSALACVSEELERQVAVRQPEATAIQRIPYGVQIPKRKAERCPGRLRLAYVGRLAEEQKRISEVTHALCRAVQCVPGAEAVLYGDGPDRSSVENILKNEGMGLPVRLIGRVASEEMQTRLLECDVLILLSDYEGLPIAVLEAMACGVVPVCLRMRSGVSELIEDGVSGLLVGDRKAGFLKAIERLMYEPGLWERLSKAARTKIETEYSLKVSTALWGTLFQNLNESVVEKRTIVVPNRLDLPPIHPALASADPRPQSTPIPVQLFRRGRVFAGRVRRRLLGKSLP